MYLWSGIRQQKVVGSLTHFNLLRIMSFIIVRLFLRCDHCPLDRYQSEVKYIERNLNQRRISSMATPSLYRHRSFELPIIKFAVI